MAKTLKEDEISRLLADHKTGNYSQRKLSAKYDVSVGYVNKITKGIDKIHEQAVNDGIAYNRALSSADEHSVNAIEDVVREKIRRENLIYGNAEKLAKKLNTMSDQIDTPSDMKTLADANDRLAITLKVADRHAPKIELNNTNASQTNVPTHITIVRDE
jgi:hypothetical protein